VEGAAAAIDYYRKAFDAVELARHADPDGRIRHAQFRIGDSPFMISDHFPEFGMMRSVQSMGGSPMSIFLYVDDADAVAARAIAAGGQECYPIADQQYGRSSGVKDPFGIIWWVTTP
jgi:PhnB protein